VSPRRYLKGRQNEGIGKLCCPWEIGKLKVKEEKKEGARVNSNHDPYGKSKKIGGETTKKIYL